MWKIIDIAEADYGCEERMPGEPLMVLVCVEAEDGRQCQFEVAENWIISQDLDVGDEWPEDIENDADGDGVTKQAEFMENYFDAVEELEETEST